MRYPPVGFHYRVDFQLEGVSSEDTRWQSVSGLAYELGTESISEGGENRFSYTLPGRASHGNLILKRGLNVDSKILKWARAAIEDFEFEICDIVVSLLDKSHDPLMSWNITSAYPVKWAVSDLVATENSIAMESLELTYQSLSKVD